METLQRLDELVDSAERNLDGAEAGIEAIQARVHVPQTNPNIPQISANVPQISANIPCQGNHDRGHGHRGPHDGGEDCDARSDNPLRVVGHTASLPRLQERAAAPLPTVTAGLEVLDHVP